MRWKYARPDLIEMDAAYARSWGITLPEEKAGHPMAWFFIEVIKIKDQRRKPETLWTARGPNPNLT